MCWRCAQYFDIASCSYTHRVNVFMFVVVTVCGSVRMCVVYRPLLKIVFYPWCVEYMLYICVRDVMDVAFSVCTVRHEAALRAWEV